MYVRSGSFTVKPEMKEELIRIYGGTAIPQIRETKGNVSAVLLEQKDAENTFVAMTLWKTEADAIEYDNSGKASKMVSYIRHTIATPPVLTTYEAYGEV